MPVVFRPSVISRLVYKQSTVKNKKKNPTPLAGIRQTPPPLPLSPFLLLLLPSPRPGRRKPPPPLPSLFYALSFSFVSRFSSLLALFPLSLSCRTSPSISATSASSLAKFITHGFSSSPTKPVHCLRLLPCCCFPSSSSPRLLLSTAVTSSVAVTGIIFPVADHPSRFPFHLRLWQPPNHYRYLPSLLPSPSTSTAAGSHLHGPSFLTAADVMRFPPASFFSTSLISIPCLISFLCLSSSSFTAAFDLLPPLC